MKFKKTTDQSFYWRNNKKRYTINMVSRHTHNGLRVKWSLWIKNDGSEQCLGLFDTARQAADAASEHHYGAIVPLSN